MDPKNNIRHRRKERIRSLLEVPSPDRSSVTPLRLAGEPPPVREHEKTAGAGVYNSRFAEPEPDPEALWKAQRQEWKKETNGGGGSRFLRSLLRRTGAAILVFALVWGLFMLRQPWTAEARLWITDALTRDMDFEAARVWYAQHFEGTPAFLPSFGMKDEPAHRVSARRKLPPPIEGALVQPFAASLTGVELAPDEGENNGNPVVRSIDTGRVQSVARDSRGGIKVTVSHTGGLTAEYGLLGGTKLAPDDWLEAGEAVGWLALVPGRAGQESNPPETPTLFFAIRKDGAYIDPSDVVDFD